MMQHINAPLVLTLVLDEISFSFFNCRRQAYFPPERNFLEAHLTLFHHLPGEELKSIDQTLKAACTMQEPVQMQVQAVKMIGRGVAYVMESAALMSLHQKLRNRWQAWLTPQDRQKLWPHVTIQNKVHPEEARKVYRQLSVDFRPMKATGVGLQLWAYRGGPWERLDLYEFFGGQ